MADKKPSKQGVGRGGTRPPKEYQFGQPNGNPRHNGAWKKEDTLRYKWEQLLQLSTEELTKVREDEKETEFLRSTANCILLMRGASDIDEATKAFGLMEKYANQVYGAPKQVNETTLNGDITGLEISFKDSSKHDS